MRDKGSSAVKMGIQSSPLTDFSRLSSVFLKRSSRDDLAASKKALFRGSSGGVFRRTDFHSASVKVNEKIKSDQSFNLGSDRNNNSGSK